MTLALLHACWKIVLMLSSAIWMAPQRFKFVLHYLALGSEHLMRLCPLPPTPRQTWLVA